MQACDLRDNKRRDGNGRWVIRDFYAELSEGWEHISSKHPEQIIKILNEWMETNPESIVAYIVLADMYINIGWKHRGNVWAYEVTDEGWEKFEENLKLAVEVIRKGEKLAEKDAHLYTRLIKIGMGLGDRELEIEGFEKGVAINKYYAPLYYDRAAALLPRWSGKKGEIEAFAGKILNQERDKGGASLYARIAMFTYRSTYPNFDRFDFSYKDIKEGFKEILMRYPRSLFYVNSYCLFACLNGDREKAKELFGKIGENYSLAVWHDKANYDKYYKWSFN